MGNKLLPGEEKKLLQILKNRFEKNGKLHPTFAWEKVLKKLENRPDKLWSLSEMEKTGGEPDVVCYDDRTDEYLFYDCSKESPVGRRSLCYDRAALDARKSAKPKNSALDMAAAMGIKILTEEQYRGLQQLGEFDMKTSSWLETPPAIRKHGGAIFADRRYDTVFVYHNGADSYYAARGFRGALRV